MDGFERLEWDLSSGTQCFERGVFGDAENGVVPNGSFRGRAAIWFFTKLLTV